MITDFHDESKASSDWVWKVNNLQSTLFKMQKKIMGLGTVERVTDVKAWRLDCTVLL